MFKFIKRLFRKVVSYGYNTRNKIFTITYDNGDIEQFKGDGTVWHKLPDFKRCGTATESYLSDLYERIKYESNI